MREKDITPSVVCPHCGSEIKKEAKFCPQCGGKLRIVDYCPQCGTKVEKGEKYCSKCGRDLIIEKPITPTTKVVTPTPKPTPKRPTGIVIMSILWFIGGLYNTLVGLGILATDLNVIGKVILGYRYSDPTVHTFLLWAIPVEATIMFVVIMLGLMQFAAIYGFLKGRTWAHSFGIAIPIIAIITSWSHMFIQLSAPPSVDVYVNSFVPVANVVLGVIYVAYLQRAHVKRWFGKGI